MNEEPFVEIQNNFLFNDLFDLGGLSIQLFHLLGKKFFLEIYEHITLKHIFTYKLPKTKFCIFVKKIISLNIIILSMSVVSFTLISLYLKNVYLLMEVLHHNLHKADKITRFCLLIILTLMV